MTAATLRELLRGKGEESFSPAELRRKAHWRWDRDQHHAAFLLFDAASRRSVALDDRNGAESARNRAAITLFQSGIDQPQALRRLEEVLAYYEAHPNRTYDNHFAEWAATALLEHAFRTDRASFAATFERLRGRCQAAGLGYPNIRPQAEEIARMAFEARARDVLAFMVSRLTPRRDLSRELAAWKAWLASDE